MTTSLIHALTQDGHEIVLEEPPLGSGTYGTVYAVAGDHQLAAKVYREWWVKAPLQQRELRCRKLLTMTGMPPPYAGKHVRVAWPESLIRLNDEHADSPYIGGYLMPRMPYWATKLSNLAREQRNGSGKARAAAREAANLLKKAVAELHRQEIVIGDVNGSNFAISPTGQLWMLDVDGWQFQEPDGMLHYAHGATDYYTHQSVFDQISGSRPNCCDPRCPLTGRPHAPTPSCRPRKPYHDKYGVQRLVNDLTRSRL